ncbi:LysR family transcriptional regulator [Caballeronia concitans]|uniref:LysR family transcriptional regulator n=2 Tax=Burkholderiaceae TaxID=119060 RepID=A0A658R493_9BURK|nr:LysR family transcriptional regulator [Caballeronia concitans]
MAAWRDQRLFVSQPCMTKLNSGIADLNLLRVFLAIWDLRSTTAAGDRLELTQPAVSHALRRLRTIFDDPLFVRTPTGMVPTDAAHRLYPPLAQALSIINDAVQQLAKFDPATARRVFRISMSDMSEFFFLPPLVALLDREACGIRIEAVNLPVESVSAAMRSGEVDLALGYVPGLDAGCVSQTLFVDHHVCVVRANHPLGKSRPTREDLAALRYVNASTNATGHRMVEQWLDELNLKRDVVVQLPHFVVAPEIVTNTDLAVIFPKSIAQRLNRGKAFRILPLPFALPPIEIQVHSHSQFTSDPGVAWLRNTIYSMFHQQDA